MELEQREHQCKGTEGRRPVGWDRMMKKMGSEKQWARSSKALKGGRGQCSLERE